MRERRERERREIKRGERETGRVIGREEKEREKTIWETDRER